jgi:hypothetical protein
MAIARALTFAALFALALLALLGVAARAQNDAASARATVQIPQAAARVLMLEVSIVAPKRTGAAHPGAVVRLRRAGGEAVEIGRLSISPQDSREQRYQFAIGAAVGRLGLAGGEAEIEVEAIDRAGGTAPALEITGARVVAR